MLTGLDRKTATEFSFFLSIPLLFGATVHEVVGARHELVPDVLLLFATGFVAAFVSAFICVRWLLRYIKTHDYTVFAWYRIVVGLVILVTAYGGSIGYND
jgi:undecaprenyl-diphosphatase